jgi:hypothetical protein
MFAAAAGIFRRGSGDEKVARRETSGLSLKMNTRAEGAHRILALK